MYETNIMWNVVSASCCVTLVVGYISLLLFYVALLDWWLGELVVGDTLQLMIGVV